MAQQITATELCIRGDPATFVELYQELNDSVYRSNSYSEAKRHFHLLAREGNGELFEKIYIYCMHENFQRDVIDKYSHDYLKTAMNNFHPEKKDKYIHTFRFLWLITVDKIKVFFDEPTATDYARTVMHTLEYAEFLEAILVCVDDQANRKILTERIQKIRAKLNAKEEGDLSATN